VKYRCHFVVSQVLDILNPKQNLRWTMILEKRAEWVQAMLAAIQFRMLHVLIYRTDIVPVILCGREIWCLMS
jgi:hypothetical protein